MANQIEPIDNYPFTSADRLLFDTNIWLYTYGPMGNPRDWRTRVYSLALKNILAAGSHIYADVLVISEFINRCARLHYGRLPVAKRPPDFKSFRACLKSVNPGEGNAACD